MQFQLLNGYPDTRRGSPEGCQSSHCPRYSNYPRGHCRVCQLRCDSTCMRSVFKRREEKRTDLRASCWLDAVVKYLLRPQFLLQKPRNGAAVGIIVAYSILLLLIAVTYLRLVCTVIFDPGYVPRGPQWHARRGRKPQLKGARDAIREAKSSDFDGNKTEKDGDLFSITYGSEPRPLALDEASPFLEEFSGKEVYTCEGNGKPIWCSYCFNWKPDRAHHCREVGRCVRKMDHFCPWWVYIPYFVQAFRVFLRAINYCLESDKFL